MAEVAEWPRWRALVVDPMGTVRLDLGSRPGMAVGDVDRELTMQIRTDLPALEDRRDDV